MIIINKHIIHNIHIKNSYRLIIFIFILVILAIFLSIFILKKYIYPTKYFDIVKEAATKNSIDPYLILAIIKTESGFNNYALSSKNAKGLMQIIDTTAIEMNEEIQITDNLEEDIFNPDVNIMLGCRYFSTLIKKYNGNYYLAICAYNAGMGNVDKWLENKIIDDKLQEYENVKLPFNETSQYLNKVIDTYKMYKKLYN